MFVAKIVQTEGRKPSLLEFYAEVQPILCKDSANRRQKKQACLSFMLRCSLSYAKIP